MNSKEISNVFMEAGFNEEDFEVICNENKIKIRMKGNNVKREDVEKVLYSCFRKNEKSLMCVSEKKNIIEINQMEAMKVTEKILDSSLTPSDLVNCLKCMFFFHEDESYEIYQKIGKQEHMLKVQSVAELCIILFKFAMRG